MNANSSYQILFPILQDEFVSSGVQLFNMLLMFSQHMLKALDMLCILMVLDRTNVLYH
jgi:hypothetical protein